MVFLTSAAWALGLAVSPPYVVVDAAPGSVVGRTLSVRNTAPHPVEVRVYLEDWWYEGEQHVFAPIGTIERSAAEYSLVEPATFRLAADERREIQLEVQVPPDASGGQYATVFFESTAGGTAAMRVASLVMIDAGGGRAPELEVSEPHVSVESGFATLSMHAEHTGDTHTFSRFKGVVRRKDGPVVARIATAEARFLPGQQRDLTERVDAQLAPGLYSIEGVLVSDNAKPVPVPSTLFTVP
ncbi:MAG: hypothetical protein R3F61_36010 [Myxococcota bacterium]